MVVQDEKIRNIILEKERLQEEIRMLTEKNEKSPSVLRRKTIEQKQHELKELEYEEKDYYRNLKYDTKGDDLSPFDKGYIKFQKVLDLYDEIKNIRSNEYDQDRIKDLEGEIRKSINSAIRYTFVDYKMFFILGEICDKDSDKFDYYTTGMVLYNHLKIDAYDRSDLSKRISLLNSMISGIDDIDTKGAMYLNFIEKIIKKDENIQEKSQSESIGFQYYEFVNRDVLYARIDDCFALEDLKNLCFKLEIDYEKLEYTSKASFIRELLLLVNKSNKHVKFISELCKERDGIDWEQYFQIKEAK